MANVHINIAARAWALNDTETRELRKYFRGQQSCAEYDNLTPVLQAAVNTATEEEQHA
jgi:hypothetical protein